MSSLMKHSNFFEQKSPVDLQTKSPVLLYPQKGTVGRMNSSWKRLLVRRVYDAAGNQKGEVIDNQSVIGDCYVGQPYTSKATNSWAECKAFAKTTLENNMSSTYSRLHCPKVDMFASSGAYSRPMLIGQMGGGRCYLYAISDKYEKGIFISAGSDLNCYNKIKSC